MTKETKREKFVRLAENRTQGVLKGIELLGNLVNSNAYEFTKKDLDKIVSAIRQEVDELENTYNKAVSKDQGYLNYRRINYEYAEDRMV